MTPTTPSAVIPPTAYVLYHENCSDGFTAAYIASLFLGTSAVYVPMTYGRALPQLAPRVPLYFVDFSLPRAELLALAEVHAAITILDHHATAQEALRDIESEAPNIHCTFDMEHSGAVLAWEHFFPGKPVPPIVAYVEDRDLWRWALPDSRAISLAYYNRTMTFAVWEELLATPIELLVAEGQILDRANERQLALVMEEVRGAWIADTLVPVVNAPLFLGSDVGNRLLTAFPEAAFAAVYRDAADGTRYWSLRSANDRRPVSSVAQEYGGGGHRNAAGFRTAPTDPRVTFTPTSYVAARAAYEDGPALV